MKTTILILGASSFLAQNYISYDSKNKLICVVRKKSKYIQKKNVKYIQINKLNSGNLKKIYSKNNFKAILNFISNNNNSEDSDANNKKILFDNLLPSIEILESIKNSKIKYFNFDSFEKKKNKISGYVLSKNILVNVINFYKEKYNLNILNINLPTVIGKFDQNKKRILPFLSRNKKLNKPNDVIVFSFAEDIVLSIKNNIEKNSKINFKIFKRKANFFLNRFLNNNKKKDKTLFLKKIDKILNFYKIGC